MFTKHEYAKITGENGDLLETTTPNIQNSHVDQVLLVSAHIMYEYAQHNTRKDAVLVLKALIGAI